MAKKIEQELAPAADGRLLEIAANLGVDSEAAKDDLLEAVIVKFQEVEEKLSPLIEQMEKDERVSKLLMLLAKGVRLEQAVDEVLDNLNDETDMADNPTYNEAIKQTQMFCEKHDMAHSQIECFVEYIEDMLSKIAKGEITKEILENLWNSFVYDAEIGAAYKAGVLKGRNMKIEDMRIEREAGDGLGEISAGGNVEQHEPKLGYIEQILKNRR